MLNQEQIDQIVSGAAKELQAQVTKNLLSSFEYQIKEEILKQTTAVVSEFMAKEIVPEIKRQLTEDRAILIEGAVNGAHQISELLAKHMIETATKNLAGYNARSIMENLFK